MAMPPEILVANVADGTVSILHNIGMVGDLTTNHLPED